MNKPRVQGIGGTLDNTPMNNVQVLMHSGAYSEKKILKKLAAFRTYLANTRKPFPQHYSGVSSSSKTQSSAHSSLNNQQNFSHQSRRSGFLGLSFGLKKNNKSKKRNNKK